MNKRSHDVSGAMTPQALLAWGVADVAYVRPAEVNGARGYAVCTADGQQIALFADRDVAFAACRQHDLEPLSVH